MVEAGLVAREIRDRFFPGFDFRAEEMREALRDYISPKIKTAADRIYREYLFNYSPNAGPPS
jgi:hypothetical protein